MTKKNITPRDWEALSAYLDGQLSAKKGAQLEARIGKNPELQTGLKELRRTRTVLRSQPKLRPPRNFTLTPEMAGQRQFTTGYPDFRLAAVMVSMLFVFLMIGDLIFSRMPGASLQSISEAPSEIQGKSFSIEDPDEMAAPLMAEEAAGFPEVESPLDSRALQEGETAFDESVEGVFTAPQRTATAPGTEQLGVFQYEAPSEKMGQAGNEMLQSPFDPSLGGEPSTPATRNGQPANRVSQLISSLTMVRVLEIVVAAAAVAMWVAVWFLRRR